MLTKFLTWWKGNGKSFLHGALAFGCVILAVLGWQWTDDAKTTFWSDFWIGAAIAGILGFAGCVYYVFTLTENKTGTGAKL